MLCLCTVSLACGCQLMRQQLKNKLNLYGCEMTGGKVQRRNLNSRNCLSCNLCFFVKIVIWMILPLWTLILKLHHVKIKGNVSHVG